MKPWQQQTYYELLEVSPQASAQEIKEAYERQTAAYAPDSVAIYTLADPAQAEDLRKRFLEAYEYLSEPDLRVEYDKSIGLVPARNREEPSAASRTPEMGATEQSAAPRTPNLGVTEQPAASRTPEMGATEQSAASRTPNLGVTEQPAASRTPEMGATASHRKSDATDASRTTGADQVPPTVTEPQSASTAPSAGPMPVAATSAPAPSPAAQASAAASIASNVEMSAAPSNANVETREVSAKRTEEPAQLAMNDLLKSAEAGQASMPNVSVSYIPQMPRPERRPEMLTVPAPSFSAGETTKVGEAAAPVQTPTANPDRRSISAEMRVATPISTKTEAPVEAAESPSASTEPQREPSRAPEAPREAPPAATEAPRAAQPELTDTQRNAAIEEADTQKNPILPPALPSKRPSGSVPAVNAAGRDEEELDQRQHRKTPQPLEVAQEIAQETAIANAEAALAQVAARVREPRPRPFDIPPDAEFNGELLRKVRQAKSLTIQQVVERTKISTRHLENIEADRYDALPATVYLRGILMNIAREYSLDPLRVSKSYLSLVPQKK
ncbi:MAG: helix-turn-helix domain-containing protein [Myxococcaceae bacterium]